MQEEKRNSCTAGTSPNTKRPHSSRHETTDGEREAKKHRSEGPNADVFHGSFIAADLPSNMTAIYTRAVRRLLPQHQKQISEAGILEEVDGATLTFEVPNKAVAAAMFKRLQNAKMYGRRWKVQYYPVSAVECAKQACLVDARLVPAAPRALVLRALGGVQGFLALIDANEKSNESALVATSTHNQKTAAGVSKDKRKAKRHADVSDSDEEESHDIRTDRDSFAATPTAAHMDGTELVENIVASFVDEGSALHARAVLSGRLIGTSGVRMFIERHR